MTAMSFRCSRPSNWIEPRQTLDADQRRRAYGPVQPMEEKPGLLRKILGLV